MGFVVDKLPLSEVSVQALTYLSSGAVIIGHSTKGPGLTTQLQL